MDHVFTDHHRQIAHHSSDAESLPATNGKTVCRALDDPLSWNGLGLDRAPRPLGTEKPESPPLTNRDSSAQGDPHFQQRIIEDETDALDPKEILELLLSNTHGAAAQLAGKLLDRFGSLGGVLAAPAVKLRHVCGHEDQHTVLRIKAARAALLTVVREPLKDRPIINNASSLMDYLFVSLRHNTTEIVRIIFLDKNNGLIKDEIHHRGTVDQASIYPREVMKRVIDLDASAIILIHNHPSGNPIPSAYDIEITKDMVNALHSVGVVFHDHVIVSRNKVTSFRRLGLIGSEPRTRGTLAAASDTTSGPGVSLFHAGVT